MFGIGFPPRLLRAFANESHIKRVFSVYLKYHRDDLLGLAYHEYLKQGRGVLLLSCRYRDLFLGKGFYPERNYLRAAQCAQKPFSSLQESCSQYDPETEILVGMQLEPSNVQQVTRLSKKGLSLSIVHRQYLNKQLDFVVTPGIVPS